MAVGAFAAYNFVLRIARHADPGRLRRWAASRGAGVGILFGLPSLRIRGLLPGAVATTRGAVLHRVVFLTSRHGSPIPRPA